MKLLSTIFLLTVIFLQTFSPYVIRIEFLLNRNFIVETLCVNKEKPKLHCSGKCYLAKQIQKQEKQDKEASNTGKDKFEIQPYFLPVNVVLNVERFSSRYEYFLKNTCDRISFPRFVFHPPAA